jgi:hypothetical protein
MPSGQAPEVLLIPVKQYFFVSLDSSQLVSRDIINNAHLQHNDTSRCSTNALETQTKYAYNALSIELNWKVSMNCSARRGEYGSLMYSKRSLTSTYLLPSL